MGLSISHNVCLILDIIGIYVFIFTAALNALLGRQDLFLNNLYITEQYDMWPRALLCL